MIGNILKVVMPPVISGAIQWLHKAWEDKKIEKYEIKRGLAIVGRTAIVSLSLYFGINWSGIGVDIDLLATTAIGVLFDYVVNRFGW